MYKRRRWKYGNIIEVKENRRAHCGAPGMPRQPKTNPTPETVRRQNQRRREEQTERIIGANFEEDDLVRTLTFAKEKRPGSMKEAQHILKRFYERLRREYRKRYFELFWIANIECTPRGAWHIHFLCNAIFGASDMIRDLWEQYGGVYDQKLKDLTGAGKKLGAYFAKTPESTTEGEHKVAEAKQSHSRNLIIPKPEVKTITGWSMDDAPRPPKGYYLIKESLYEGVTDDGWRYRGYKFARIRPKPPRDRTYRPPGERNENTHLHSRGLFGDPERRSAIRLRDHGRGPGAEAAGRRHS